MTEEIKIIDQYLLKVTTFSVVSKEELKKEICNLIDKRFEYFEKDLRKANDAIHKLQAPPNKTAPKKH